MFIFMQFITIINPLRTRVIYLKELKRRKDQKNVRKRNYPKFLKNNYLNYEQYDNEVLEEENDYHERY